MLQESLQWITCRQIILSSTSFSLIPTPPPPPMSSFHPQIFGLPLGFCPRSSILLPTKITVLPLDMLISIGFPAFISNRSKMDFCLMKSMTSRIMWPGTRSVSAFNHDRSLSLMSVQNRLIRSASSSPVYNKVVTFSLVKVSMQLELRSDLNKNCLLRNRYSCSVFSFTSW